MRADAGLEILPGQHLDHASRYNVAVVAVFLLRTQRELRRPVAVQGDDVGRRAQPRAFGRMRGAEQFIDVARAGGMGEQPAHRHGVGEGAVGVVRQHPADVAVQAEAAGGDLLQVATRVNILPAGARFRRSSTRSGAPPFSSRGP